MKITSFKKVALLANLMVTIGVAHADYKTYTLAINAARPLYEAGDYVGAQRIAEEALTLAKTPSEKAGAYLRIGATFNKRKLYSQAREQWAKALALPNTSFEDKSAVQSYIAVSYGDEKNWSQARAEYQKLFDMPGISYGIKLFARQAIITTYIGDNNNVEARKLLLLIAEDAMMDDSIRALSYMQMADLFAKENQLNAAFDAYTKASEMPNASPETAIAVRLALARTYVKQGNPQKAQELLGEAQAASVERAKTLEAGGKLAAARSTVEAALMFGTIAPLGTPAPVDARMRVKVGQLFLKEGKPEEARTYFESFLRRPYRTGLGLETEAALNSSRQSARLGIAQSYADEKNRAQAALILKELLASQPLDEAVKTEAEKLLGAVS